MPIYEYRCSACGQQCELIQKFSDEPATTCPNCGKEGLNRLISAPSFQLKGSGWYVTDFRDKGKPKSSESSAADQTTKSEGDKPNKKEDNTKQSSDTPKD